MLIKHISQTLNFIKLKQDVTVHCNEIDIFRHLDKVKKHQGHAQVSTPWYFLGVYSYDPNAQKEVLMLIDTRVLVIGYYVHDLLATSYLVNKLPYLQLCSV
ncbi:hypothetical protein DGG96_07365 [Legionella qingyii]|uniref:Uncharacterized protein n=1 Tax=Legionella qingyii TaxID=2184757 RepID=A0A317U4W2_9GAMM|nr:hypothetical protein DGG96_07365 [Legionella qingyii]